MELLDPLVRALAPRPGRLSCAAIEFGEAPFEAPFERPRELVIPPLLVILHAQGLPA